MSAPPPHADPSDSDGDSGLIAGLSRTVGRSLQSILRPLSRRASTVLSKQTLGRLPVKQVAKVADTASNVTDLLDAASSESLLQQLRSGKLREIARSTASASFQFARGAALGAVLFETYDVAETLLLPAVPPNFSFAVPALAGSAAGLTHGFSSSLLDSLSTLPSSRPAIAPPHPPLRLLHHSLSHATLFGSYEALNTTFRSFLPPHPDPDHVGPEHFLCVAVAGGVAGACSQAVSGVAEVWEESGRVSLRGASERVARAGVLRAAGPAALGFLAFEFSKSMYGGGGGE